MNYFKKRKIKKAWSMREISPEDIFMDSKNLANLDESQLEGRISKPISKKINIVVIGAFVLFLLVFSGRLVFLQVLNSDVYAGWSEENLLKREVVFANRGIIEDRNGTPLAWNEKSATGTLEYPQRVYVGKNGFSHLLGYAKPPKKDKKGVFYEENFTGMGGIEEYYDDELKGSNGEVLVEENAKQEEQSRSVVVKAVDGENLRLTVDSRIQEELFSAIKNLSERAGFVGGAGVLMDVHSGEVLALVSFPEYDSQILSLGKDQEKIEGYLSNEANVFLNRAVSGRYTPGSIVKPFIAVAALEEGIISPNKELLSEGALVVPNSYFPDKPTIFRDWRAHGWVDMTEALAWSSNEYFFKVGGGFEKQRGLGIKKINEYMKKFKLPEKTGIDIYGEENGIVPSPDWKETLFGEEWRIGDTYNTSIGQYGFQLTPLEVLRGIAAVANGGYLVTPHLNTNKTGPKNKIDGIGSEEVKVVQRGMREGVLYGTASQLNIAGLSVAAKTGTAEIGPSNSLVNSWVSGFLPYENPQYAFVVVMERAARENTYGATLAAEEFFKGLLENVPDFLPAD